MDSQSRIDISIDYRKYKAHRLVWLYMHGRWPSMVIDHINGQPSDNRLCNLREANRSQNGANRGATRKNTSGFKGVTFCKFTERWAAQINFKGRNIKIGRFDSPEEAHAAYLKAATNYFGEFSHA